MITRESRGHDLGRIFRYAARLGEYADKDDTKVGPCYLLNSGLSSLGDIDIAYAQTVVQAIGDIRPDLKHTALHLTLSPPPDLPVDEARHQCLNAFQKAASDLDVTDRIAFLAFHTNASPQEGAPATHLHAVIALPCPETGQSVSLHRVRERLRDSVANASIDESGTDFAPVDQKRQPPQEKSASDDNQPAVAEAQQTQTIKPTAPPLRKKTKRRKRDRGMEL